MFSALKNVTDELRQDLPWAIFITGAVGEAFCTGFDVNPENPLVADFLKVLDSNDIEPARTLLNRQATVMDLGTVIISTFNNQKVSKILNLTKDEDPLYIIPVGKR
ncbi:MAG: nitroreductase family protein [Thermodesulfobacteriota bacterium]|nr:nitroreductase family protein [Thermodesulfobacteriota bacterium]